MISTKGIRRRRSSKFSAQAVLTSICFKFVLRIDKHRFGLCTELKFLMVKRSKITKEYKQISRVRDGMTFVIYSLLSREN